MDMITCTHAGARATHITNVFVKRTFLYLFAVMLVVLNTCTVIQGWIQILYTLDISEGGTG